MQKIEHKNNFNILRFLFASLVIVSHAPELQDGNRSHEILTRIFGTITFGDMAVDSFFVLSGYLIVKSWQDRPNIFSFLSSRILRIYPGFIAASLFGALVVGPAYGLASYFHDFRLFIFIRGLTILELAGIPSVFPGTPYAALNGALWTIPYEFKCYLFVLVFGMIGAFSRRSIWLYLFLTCTIIYIANRTGVAVVPGEQYFRLLMAFTGGGCFYLYRDLIAWRSDMAWVALLVFGGFLFIKPLAEPALCIFWGYAFLYYAIAGTSLLAFNRFPDVSYGVYLYAFPINKMLLWSFPGMNVYMAMTAVFILSIFAGTVSWYAVEKPFIGLKKLFR